jgi:ATP-dependent RNA helicase RhlB
MPIKLITKLASKLRNGSKQDASSPRGDQRQSPPAQAGGRGSKGKRRQDSSTKQGAAHGEVWRPGDGSARTNRGDASKGESASGERGPRRRGSRGGQRRKRSGGGQEGAQQPQQGESARQPRAEQQSQPRRDGSRRSTGEGGSRGSQKRQRTERQSGKQAGPDTSGNQSQADWTQRMEKLAAAHAAWSVEQFSVEPEEGKTRFHDLDLPSEIMHSIEELGFKYCTPIQAGVLQSARKGRNVVGQAQTGTGKTAAFLTATFARFHDNPKACKPGQPRALVIAPTRELVVQIARDAEGLGKYSGVRCQAIYGGMDLEKQRKRLEGGPIELIAATPGRLLDFVNRRVLDLSQIEVLVIDEADRMLDMGFIPDVRRIVSATPRREQRQTLFFSATMNDDVQRLSDSWMPDPVKVEIEPEQVAVDTVKQLVYIVTTNEKFKVLFNILNLDHVGRVLVFANRRVTTEKLARELQSRGIDCELLSGAVNQNKRMRVLEDFKSGKVSVVVATDVAGRGLHVAGIDHVVNFDFPYEPDDYVHRIGRTGRAGESGTAISFACEDESFIIPEIETYIGEELTCMMPEEILLKEPPHPFRKSTIKTDSTPTPGRGGSGGPRRSSGGRRPSGGSRRSSGAHADPRRSGARHK